MGQEITAPQKKILIVDDEPNVRESLRTLLGRFYEISTAEDGDDALELLEKLCSEKNALISKSGEKTIIEADKGQNKLEVSMSTLPDLIVLDLLMPGLDGFDTLERIRSDFPELPVIMLTANTGVKTAVRAMKTGAVDYLNKPFDVDELLNLIEVALDQAAGKKSTSTGFHAHSFHRGNLPELPGDFGCIVGQNPFMAELYQKIEQVAVRNTTVLISGESGTGKELVAREVHRKSPRAKNPFVPINCAAIPESLIESELFGHEKGAFTHAIEKRIGQFEQAHRGTLFLDEIGELSLNVQVKMLRFLQEQEFYRVGRSKPVKVDVRIIAATNKSLETAIRSGLFRQDLYYRINVVSLEILPLRERKEDIPRLIEFFINRLSYLYGGRKIKFTEAALQVLLNYSWPGNVRELENVTESLLALAKRDEISEHDLPLRIKQIKVGTNLTQEVLDGHMPFEEAERAFETEIIIRALKKANFVQTKAAELLGISRRILKYKMDKLGISDNQNEYENKES